ncbi:MAG: hypothetical protein IJX99_09070 [Clostridia bacterium]|nr:hypothetical protein [Clostridia bacterium]
MITKTKLSFAEMLDLRATHVPVSEKVFMLLAAKDEVEHRQNLVDRYGYHSNITFFSDGTVFMDGRRSGGATGWVGTTPPLNMPPFA